MAGACCLGDCKEERDDLLLQGTRNYVRGDFPSVLLSGVCGRSRRSGGSHGSRDNQHGAVLHRLGSGSAGDTMGTPGEDLRAPCNFSGFAFSHSRRRRARRHALWRLAFAPTTRDRAERDGGTCRFRTAVIDRRGAWRPRLFCVGRIVIRPRQRCARRIATIPTTPTVPATSSIADTTGVA